MRDPVELVKLYNTGRDQLKLIHLSVPKAIRTTLSHSLRDLLEGPPVSLPLHGQSHQSTSTLQSITHATPFSVDYSSTISPPQRKLHPFHAKEPSSTPLNTDSFLPKGNSQQRRSSTFPRSTIVSTTHKQLNAAYIDRAIDEFMQKL